MLWSTESVLSFSLYFTQSRFLKAEAVVEGEILFVLVSMTWHTFPRISALIECQSVLALKSVVLGIDIMPGFRRQNCSNCSLCMPACTCVCYEYCTQIHLKNLLKDLSMSVISVGLAFQDIQCCFYIFLSNLHNS